jgi:hypothetical protein
MKLQALILTALLLLPGLARAQSTIRQPTAHPHYRMEVEPHLMLDFPGAIGPGARVTFPVADEGFLPKLNDSVGVGVGGDIAVDKKTELIIPVVMQWNFWFTRRWSAFGEPGIGLRLGKENRPTLHVGLGGRFLFSESVGLTLRVGWPASSVGVSFFL